MYARGRKIFLSKQYFIPASTRVTLLLLLKKHGHEQCQIKWAVNVTLFIYTPDDRKKGPCTRENFQPVKKGAEIKKWVEN